MSNDDDDNDNDNDNKLEGIAGDTYNIYPTIVSYI